MQSLECDLRKPRDIVIENSKQVMRLGLTLYELISIWESKLPSNYRFLIEKLFDESVVNLGKKDIYVRLCRPNPFDGGTKEMKMSRKAKTKRSNSEEKFINLIYNSE